MPMCDISSVVIGDDPVLSAFADQLAVYRGSEGGQLAHLCGTGPVAAFEERLRSHYGMRHALCVSNATCGLLAVAMALELREAELIAPPLTFGGSLAPFLLLRNRPVFSDIDPALLTLDPERVVKNVTAETRALLAVDLFGVPADDRSLRAIADEYGLLYIHDAAQSFGASREGRLAGSMADALVLSFGPGKRLFTGEGGAILTNHEDLYERLIWAVQHPYRQRVELGLGMRNELAMNFRIHPLAAAWGCAEFDSALERLQEGQRIGDELVRSASATGLLQSLPYEELALRPSYYRITLAWKDGARPDELLDALSGCGHRCRLSPLEYELFHRHPDLRADGAAPPPPCPVAEDQATRRFVVEEVQ